MQEENWITKKLKIPPPESWPERARALGMETEKNEATFLAVEEMIKRPLSTQQMREQIAKNAPHLVRYDDPTQR